MCAYYVQMKNEAIKSSFKGGCVHRQNEMGLQSEVSPVVDGLSPCLFYVALTPVNDVLSSLSQSLLLQEGREQLQLGQHLGCLFRRDPASLCAFLFVSLN